LRAHDPTDRGHSTSAGAWAQPNYNHIRYWGRAVARKLVQPRSSVWVPRARSTEHGNARARWQVRESPCERKHTQLMSANASAPPRYAPSSSCAGTPLSAARRLSHGAARHASDADAPIKRGPALNEFVLSRPSAGRGGGGRAQHHDGTPPVGVLKRFANARDAGGGAETGARARQKPQIRPKSGASTLFQVAQRTPASTPRPTAEGGRGRASEIRPRRTS